MRRTYGIIFLMIILILCSITGCSKNSTPQTKAGFYFDTAISISIYTIHDEEPDTIEADAIMNDAFSLCAHYESLLSATIEGSDIDRINKAGGAPVTVDPDTATLLKEALSYCALSDGKFDITVGELVRLWDFSSKTMESKSAHEVPSDEKIQAALSHVGYQNVTVVGNTVTLKDPAASIELGAVAKGYIADRLTDFLKSEGVTSAIIDLGGNLAVIGNKPDGQPFHLGIKKPFSQTGEVITALPASDTSLVTSGIYERYFEKNGQRYHHLLDATTGYPLDNTLSSVSILCPSSLKADAFSTLCYLLGEEKGRELIASTPDTEAVFIRKDGTIIK